MNDPARFICSEEIKIIVGRYLHENDSLKRKCSIKYVVIDSTKKLQITITENLEFLQIRNQHKRTMTRKKKSV